LDALDVLNRVAKRAQHEAFAFDVEETNVHVRNESYADPSAHEYTVRIDEGIPESCTCPADAHYESACKHRVAVAIRKPVLTAATRALTDGGTTTEADASVEAPEDCTCASLGDLPCWECVRTGRREFPE
jgi:hypothetical protein